MSVRVDDARAQVHPELEAAKCMRVEGLIHCRRYKDAAAACEQLLTDSVDAMYLQAELRWRQNELAGAMEAAEAAVRAPCSDGPLTVTT
jgi:hypothetical protein